RFPTRRSSDLWVFTINPIVAGLDKFFYLLVDWEKYFPDYLMSIVPVSLPTFVMIIGVIEIIAGFIVLTKTEIGAYIVSAWLAVIALILVFSGGFFDVAIRDIIMSIAAFLLSWLPYLRKKQS